MRRSNRSVIVTWNATRRANGSMALEISQRISSARTAARAMVVEKVMPEIRRTVSRDVEVETTVRLGDEETSPARMGKILLSTMVNTRRKVAMKGREANVIASKAGTLPPGRHSSQSSLLGSMDETAW